MPSLSAIASAAAPAVAREEAEREREWEEEAALAAACASPASFRIPRNWSNSPCVTVRLAAVALSNMADVCDAAGCEND
jgi:hypothetical protein